MRANGKLVLIDLDSCASVVEGDFAGAKYSSAYIPPEMVYRDHSTPNHQYLIRSIGYQGIQNAFPLEPLPASPSYDMWSLGVTLFQMCSGKPLFLADNEDNIDGDTLEELYDWTDKLKAQKLLQVPDLLARNLLSQLLQKDPACRLTAERTLNHSFLTGKKATRMLGEEPEYDLFISYRVAADAAHVERDSTTCSLLGISPSGGTRCVWRLANRGRKASVTVWLNAELSYQSCPGKLSKAQPLRSDRILRI